MLREEFRVDDRELYSIPYEDRSLNKYLRLRAEADHDRPYMTIGDITYSYGRTDALCRAVARGLKDRSVTEGDHVMIMAPNCPEFVLAWFASAILGAVTVPINCNLRGMLLESVIEDARPKVLVVHETILSALAGLRKEVLDSLKWIVVIGSVPTTDEGLPVAKSVLVEFGSLVVHEDPDPAAPENFRRLQMISYTSGTTGPSKGVMVSNSAGFSPAQNIIRVFGMTRDDILYAPLPLFHGMSSRQGIVPALALGAQIVVDERFTASGYWRRAAEVGATLGMVVHAVMPLIKSQPPSEYDRKHTIRALFNGLHDQEFEDRFGVHITEAFAMTETSHILCSPFPERRWGSTGRVHPDWEVKLVGPDGFEVPVGEPGELVARPIKPFVMMEGYLNKPEATLEAFKGLWFNTGDILRVDEDGYYFYVDRKKDRIRRRGENVSSSEVERCVSDHADIVECVALPYPSGDGEDDIRVVAVVRPDSGLHPKALSTWLEDKMPKFMWPRYLEFVTKLPRTATDKVAKVELMSRGLDAGVWDRNAHQASREELPRD